MKTIIKEINQTIESSVTGIVFTTKKDKIDKCIITVGDNTRLSKPIKKIVIENREIPKELLQAVEDFVDYRIDNEEVVDPSIVKSKRSKKGK